MNSKDNSCGNIIIFKNEFPFDTAMSRSITTCL
jgi:hypothetical protein